VSIYVVRCDLLLRSVLHSFCVSAVPGLSSACVVEMLELGIVSLSVNIHDM
jgi:hypothetical protein